MEQALVPRQSGPTQEALALELLAASAYDDGDITEVIRPAAILGEEAARTILAELALHDVRSQGLWLAEPGRWRRFDRPWDAGAAEFPCTPLIGTIQVIYGAPTRHEITIYRATVTQPAATVGWTVTRLCNEALQFAGLDLDSCPRAALDPPPRPFRFR